MNRMTVMVGAGVLAAVWGTSAGAESGPLPAPANEFRGMQEREEVYQFTAKPAVMKEGGKTFISFASKGKCDVTVTILDKDGKVVRHLASGVLGSNAPWPFQQNSLSQKIEWDGLKDDFSKAETAGCKVKVGLGLQATRAKSDFDPYVLGDKVTYAVDPEGAFYLPNGLKYGKDGKYAGRFYPPPSGDLDRVIASGQVAPLQAGGELGETATTQWGDKVKILGWSGWEMRERPFAGDIFKTLGEAAFAKLKITRDGALPAPIAAAKLAAAPPVKVRPPARGTCYPRMAVNRSTDELYIFGRGSYIWAGELYRVDGKTLEWDKSFLPGGELKNVSEVSIGPNGNVYARIGSSAYGQWIVCVDPRGKVVNFGGDAVSLPLENKWTDGKEIYMGFFPSPIFRGAKVLWTGLRHHSNIHERGLYVSPRGFIVAQMQQVDAEYAARYGIKNPLNGTVSVWSTDGKLLTANAVGGVFNGHGVAMDREGNIYSARGQDDPGVPKKIDGLPDLKPDIAKWGGWGSIAKFRSLGENVFEQKQLWAYSAVSQSGNQNCTCKQQLRWDLDYWARLWYPARQLGSIVVVDANGNRIARLGRYGTREEEKKPDDLRFMWPTLACASDTAAYVLDHDGYSRLAISYAAEETVPVQ